MPLKRGLDVSTASLIGIRMIFVIAAAGMLVTALIDLFAFGVDRRHTAAREQYPAA